MNPIVNNQIQKMIADTEAFTRNCELASEMDDGNVDQAEAELLAAIKKVTADYVSALESLMK